eukprot:TRINITY_DN4864_c0_g1_i2.p1 TRINITY_DN4864_c0_g1~~TRINITY_DN4864_c0_g1_i2.p1  ORF type:complete len:411 (-),score=128.80 TRINITY_DN4864_c0_g1_i2:225-1409(-)
MCIRDRSMIISSPNKNAPKFNDDTNEAVRRKDRNFSDLFGSQRPRTTQSEVNTPKKLIASNAQWTEFSGPIRSDSDITLGGQHVSSKDNPLYSEVTYAPKSDIEPISEAPEIIGAAKITEDSLGQKRDTNVDKSKPTIVELLSSPHHLEDSASPKKKKTVKEDPVFIYDITKMPDDFEKKQFQKLVHEKGLHVVDLRTSQKNVSSANRELSGRVQLRAKNEEEIESLKRDLEEKGYLLKEHTENNAKKSKDYDVKKQAAKFNAGKDGQYSTKQALHNQLQSSGDLFGSNVAKWDPDWQEKQPKIEEEPELTKVGSQTRINVPAKDKLSNHQGKGQDFLRPGTRNGATSGKTSNASSTKNLRSSARPTTASKKQKGYGSLRSNHFKTSIEVWASL